MMGVSLRDARHAPDDRTWIQSVYPEYLEELSEVSHSGTGVFPVHGEHGGREAELLARWFRDERSHPLLILDRGNAVGFALVSRPLVPKVEGSAQFRMAEFYVRRAHRRLGIGRAAAVLIFSRFAGTWEVTEAQSNSEAVTFWRRVIQAYTRGRYRERLADGEVRQHFETSNAPTLGQR
jgi:predicted acetyltransferase